MSGRLTKEDLSVELVREIENSSQGDYVSKNGDTITGDLNISKINPSIIYKAEGVTNDFSLTYGTENFSSGAFELRRNNLSAISILGQRDIRMRSANGSEFKVQDLNTSPERLEATLLNGFTGEVFYRKTAQGLVNLSIGITNVPTVDSTVAIANLPVGFRPQRNLPIPVMLLNTSPFNSQLLLVVNSQGNISFVNSSGFQINPNAGLSGGITYHA